MINILTVWLPVRAMKFEPIANGHHGNAVWLGAVRSHILKTFNVPHFQPAVFSHVRFLHKYVTVLSPYFAILVTYIAIFAIFVM